MNEFGIFNTIQKNYRFIKSNPKDQLRRDSIHWIAPYMNKLLFYSRSCPTITEFGVNQVCSTWAFLMSKPKRLVSIDIDLHKRATKKVPEFNNINRWLLNAQDLAKKSKIDFQAIEANTIEIDIEPTDLLFIDSKHTEEHLSLELERHKDKVRKYIIFHDTTMFPIWEPIQALLDTKEFDLVERIDSFCGLTIIKRNRD